MATAKATPKKKAAPKKPAAKPQPDFDLRAELEGITARMDIMIQQFDAILARITPPKSK